MSTVEDFEQQHGRRVLIGAHLWGYPDGATAGTGTFRQPSSDPRVRLGVQLKYRQARLRQAEAAFDAHSAYVTAGGGLHAKRPTWDAEALGPAPTAMRDDGADFDFSARVQHLALLVGLRRGAVEKARAAIADLAARASQSVIVTEPNGEKRLVPATA